MPEAMKIFATMATMPGREESFGKAVASLMEQVDLLHVHYNGFPKPDGAEVSGVQLPGTRTKLTFTRSEENLGDQMKFLAAPQHTGWHLACDDDIIYPPDYAATMVSAAEFLGGPVSAHGATLRQPFESYYRSRTSYHCTANLAMAVRADVLGTGVCCYHSDHAPQGFESANMADIWAAISWKRQGLELGVISHQENWIKLADPKNTDTIWHASQRKDGSFLDTGEAQTAAIKAHADLFFGASH